MFILIEVILKSLKTLSSTNFVFLSIVALVRHLKQSKLYLVIKLDFNIITELLAYFFYLKYIYNKLRILLN